MEMIQYFQHLMKDVVQLDFFSKELFLPLYFQNFVEVVRKTKSPKIDEVHWNIFIFQGFEFEIYLKKLFSEIANFV